MNPAQSAAIQHFVNGHGHRVLTLTDDKTNVVSLMTQDNVWQIGTDGEPVIVSSHSRMEWR